MKDEKNEGVLHSFYVIICVVLAFSLYYKVYTQILTDAFNAPQLNFWQFFFVFFLMKATFKGKNNPTSESYKFLIIWYTILLTIFYIVI